MCVINSNLSNWEENDGKLLFSVVNIEGNEIARFKCSFGWSMVKVVNALKQRHGWPSILLFIDGKFVNTYEFTVGSIQHMLISCVPGELNGDGTATLFD